MEPLIILGASVAYLVFAVGRLKLHPFFALMTAALVVALCSAHHQPGSHRMLHAIDQVMAGAGGTMGRLGFPIALAALIGCCLTESGGAQTIVRSLVGWVGQDRAPWALLVCAFALSAPVFVDTVVMLLLPLALELSRRTGRNHLGYVLAVGFGGAISNGVVPPAPGPFFVAEALKLNMGTTILIGLAFGVPLLAGARMISRLIDRRALKTGTLPESAPVMPAGESGGRVLPGFTAAVAPVLVPILLIGAASIADSASSGQTGASRVIEFLGNKNIALLIGAALALWTYRRQQKTTWDAVNRAVRPSLEVAGVIILIIAAGGAYGGAIRDAGVGGSVRLLIGDHPINYVFMAWVTAALLRAAQGSATVAAVTAVGVVQSIAGSSGFGVHPIYILLAIGFGSKFLSWMNDSGFWLISRLGNLTQKETLNSWSIGVSALSLCGLAEVLLMSRLFPHLAAVH